MTTPSAFLGWKVKAETVLRTHTRGLVQRQESPLLWWGERLGNDTGKLRSRFIFNLFPHGSASGFCLSVFEMAMILFNNAKPFSLPTQIKSDPQLNVQGNLYSQRKLGGLQLPRQSVMAEMDRPHRSVSLPHIKFHWNIRHSKRGTSVSSNYSNAQQWKLLWASLLFISKLLYDYFQSGIDPEWIKWKKVWTLWPPNQLRCVYFHSWPLLILADESSQLFSSFPTCSERHARNRP